MASPRECGSIGEQVKQGEKQRLGHNGFPALGLQPQHQFFHFLPQLNENILPAGWKIHGLMRGNSHTTIYEIDEDLKSAGFVCKE